MTNRALAFLIALVVAGCAGGSAETEGRSSPTAHHSASPEPSAAPTLAATFERDAEVPDGAIEILMTFGPDFEPTEAQAKAGTVVFALRNDKGDGPPALHNFLLGTSVDEPPLATSPSLASGFSGTLTVEGIEVGTYTYWCTILGPDGTPHSQMGMTGTLTVTP